VAGFLRAERTPTWQTSQSPPRDVPESFPEQPIVVRTGLALGLDYESEATAWFPRMAEEVTVGVLDHAKRLSSFISHATAVTYIAGSLGLVSGDTETASAAIGAATGCSITFALAATTTVVRATGNIVRGTGSLETYEYDTVAPGLDHIVSQTLLFGLGKLKELLGHWVNTGVADIDAVGKISSTLIGWTDLTYVTTRWMLDCYFDRGLCLGSDETQTGASPVNSVGKCDEAQVAGGDTPETRTFDVGVTCGDLSLQYETYTIADQITVQYEGKTIVDTGCVGANATIPIHICGSSTEVIVAVQPNCAGSTGTSWTFTLSCPR
jgi:hypothetical protein